MVGSNGGLEVRVQTPKFQTDFVVKRNTTGKQLFELVVDILELREHWFFGLKFVDQDGGTVWLQAEEKLASRAQRKQSPLHFTFCVRFWPQSSAWTLGDAATELMFLQVREAVLDDALFCPLPRAIELAACALQARCGDFTDARLEDGQLKRNRHLPQKLQSLLREDSVWRERVTQLHKRMSGLPSRDAMHEYLQLAQTLPDYGATFYNIRRERPLGDQPYERRISWFWLGVTPFGVNVYVDKLAPLVRIPWEQLRSVRFHRCRFTMKMHNGNKLQFFTRSFKKSQDLLATITGQKRALTLQMNCDGNSSSAAPVEEVSSPATFRSYLPSEGSFEVHLGQREDSIAEDVEQEQEEESSAWPAPLEAAGWLQSAQQWNGRETSGSSDSLLVEMTSKLHFKAQSFDFGLVSSQSDFVTDGDLTLTDVELENSRVKHRSTTSSDSGVFRFSVTSDDVFV